MVSYCSAIKFMVTTIRSKAKSRSHHDIAYLQPLGNVNTKYQLPTPYSFRDIARQNFIGQGHYGKVKSRSHHDIAHLHPQPMSLPSINALHLTVSEIQPRQTFSRPNAHPDTMGENNTLTALKGCGVIKLNYRCSFSRLVSGWCYSVLTFTL